MQVSLAGKSFTARIVRFLTAALLTVFLFGCVSVGGPSAPFPQLEELKVESIRERIQEGDLFNAYQDVFTLKGENNSGSPSQELAALEEELLRRLKDDFRNHVEAEEYEDALRYFLSLKVLGEESGDYSEAELLALTARRLVQDGDLPLAFLYALKALAAGLDTEEHLLFSLERAVELGNRQASERLVGLLREKGYALPPDLAELDFTPPGVEQFVKGTVTIYVDRGIKIERGMGYPDRVIGSGFFIDRRGYLLTNYHVISSEVDPKYEGYSRLYIRLSESVEEKIPARVVGWDRIFDLALIKTELEPEFILSSDREPVLKPGDSILAIGSPAGLENSVTSGIVSAVGRRFLQIGDTVQVDAPVNPGNSGGALLDAQGRLVGIIFAGIEQFEGLNFAIPFHWVNKVLPRLYREGEARHAWLGLGLYEDEDELKVIYAVPGNPAHRAGIQVGDVIESVNGQSFSTVGDLQDALLDLDSPSLVEVAWRHENEERRGILALNERPFSPIEYALEKDSRENIIFPLFGMRIEQVGSSLWRNNYVVKEVLNGSVADETGLSENDPFIFRGWKVDTEKRYVIVQLFVKKKKGGFLESLIPLAAYIESDIFV
jgi:serine protease Do